MDEENWIWKKKSKGKREKEKGTVEAGSGKYFGNSNKRSTWSFSKLVILQNKSEEDIWLTVNK